MPARSSITFASGPRQFVVHDAFEITSWEPSYLSSLTPITTVMSSPLAGAEMITFFAPASRCLAAASRVVNRPVDSITTSTPRSLHGSAAGSRSASVLTSRPSIVSDPSPASTVPGNGPYTESYLSRCASVPVSVMSLTATISTSAPDSCAARKTLRPMRPKPLIPTRTGMAMNPFPGRRTDGEGRERVSLGARRGPVDIAVLDVDDVALVAVHVRREVLRDAHGPVPAARAPDGHHEVRLALSHVLREEVVEQRQH